MPMRSPMRSGCPAFNVATPLGGAGREQQDHRRAHVEARHFITLGEFGGREQVAHGQRRDLTIFARRDVAVPHRGHAADVQRADEDDRPRHSAGVEAAENSFVAREESGHELRGGAIHAEQPPWNVERLTQFAGHAMWMR